MTREEKQKAIYVLKNSAPTFPLKKPEAYNQTIKQVIDWLEQEPSWTPISEGLPKKGGDYLTTISFDIGAKEPIREVYKNFFCVLSQKWLNRDEDVIAWMPLPKVYKAESEGENDKT